LSIHFLRWAFPFPRGERETNRGKKIVEAKNAAWFTLSGVFCYSAQKGAKGEDMPIPGKIELVIKINEFHSDVAVVTNGWKQFKVENGGRFFSVTVRPAIFKKLEEAPGKYPQWVAAIGGQLGPQEGDTFTLLQPVINVFEYKPKPKEPKPDATPPAEDSSA
jgi:hypothetical protein